MSEPILTDELSNVQFINNTIRDSLVVAAARVSFNKDSMEFDPERDEKLINYLVDHNHWSPLAHPHGAFVLNKPLDDVTLRELFKDPIHGLSWGSSGLNDYKTVDYVSGSLWGLLNLAWRLQSQDLMDKLEHLAPISIKAFCKDKVMLTGYTACRDGVRFLQVIPKEEDKVTTLRIEAPLALARQFWKHQQGFTFSELMPWNEASGRYIDMSTNGYFIPSEFHAQATNKKQGVDKDTEVQEIGATSFEDLVKLVDHWYQTNNHIGNEERRLLLPACTKTSWYWTARRKDWDRVISLRTDSHAQLLTQQVATQIKEVLDTANY